MIIINKDVIQSYIFTTAKYNFSVDEKRILYRLVELVQYTLEGKKLISGYIIEDSELKSMKSVKMPISSFLKDPESENYSAVKKALKNLRNKTFEYQNGRSWKLIGIIELPTFEERGLVEFKIHQEVYEALLDFSKGYRKYELKTAMSFESTYAMRFYELLSGQKRPLTFKIEDLKVMFNLVGKYKKPSDFIKRVVETAKIELDKSSPYSFEYNEIKKSNRTESISFHPVYISKNRDPKLEKKEETRNVSLRWDLDKMAINYLVNNFQFTETEIKNNMDLFVNANKKFDLLLHISGLKGKAIEAKNPKGYIINSIKKQLK